MPRDHSLIDLAQLAGVTPRTIRYYIAQGLLPSPGQVGPGARYGEAHLGRLLLIRRLQREHQPLAAIRARLAGLGDDDVARLMGDVGTVSTPPSTALQYVQDLLRGTPGRNVMPASLAAMTTSIAAAAAPGRAGAAASGASPTVPAATTSAAAVPAQGAAPQPGAAPPRALAGPASGTLGAVADAIGPDIASAGPLRSQWERFAFGADVEIHVRRPLVPGDVRRLERLLAFARQLFEGDQP